MEFNVNELLKNGLLDKVDENSKEFINEEIIDLNELIDEYMDDFAYQIKSRGKEYYEKGFITSIIKLKDENTFYAKVKGSLVYNIEINYDLEEEWIDYDCTCPCEFPCKHIYAVLLAIKNHEYSELKLMPTINENTKTLDDIINSIPAQELKEYILSPEGKEHISIEEEPFKNYFANYMPKQYYEYYYNNLYNKIALKEDTNNLLNKYMDKVKVLLQNKEYNEAFHILESIIEVYNDTHTLNNSFNIINLFPLIAMNLRIIYRKCDDDTKREFVVWENNLIQNNYYDNIYLEDIIISIN